MSGITYLVCPHGIDKRHHCQSCRNRVIKYEDYLKEKQEILDVVDDKIPITADCPAKGPCACTGRCQEIIGYRDPLPGEK
jgi:hypothetical protein